MLYHKFREWDVKGKIIKVGDVSWLQVGKQAGKMYTYKTIGGGVRSR